MNSFCGTENAKVSYYKLRRQRDMVEFIVFGIVWTLAIYRFD